MVVLILDSCDISNNCTRDCHSRVGWENSQDVQVRDVELQYVYNYSKHYYFTL